MRLILRFISDLFYGKFLSLDFFRTYWLPIFTGMVLLMIYITNKYNTQTKMEEIRALNTELEIVTTESIRLKSAYMSRVRESSMQQMVDSFHLGLTIQEQPPYALKQK